MYYTRCGMGVVGLGRWKSSAVLRYIEEALQCMPANRKLLEERAKTDPFLREDLEVKHKGDLCPKVARREVMEDGRSPEDKKEAEGEYPPDIPKLEGTSSVHSVENLWAISTSRSKRTAHVVTRAAWGLDLDSWSTACGWHFAERFVKVKLAKMCPDGVRVCVICEQSNMVRDKRQGMAASWNL